MQPTDKRRIRQGSDFSQLGGRAPPTKAQVSSDSGLSVDYAVFPVLLIQARSRVEGFGLPVVLCLLALEAACFPVLN